MPINTDIRIEALRAQFRAQQADARRTEKKAATRPPGAARGVSMDVRLQAYVSASGLHAGQGASDRVEISLAANMTVEAANGIVMDSVVEQINRAIQEAGIDLSVEEARASGLDTTPKGTARRIADFATGFFEAFRQNHADETDRGQVAGFMSLIRGAIEEGFQQARDFLEGITSLSETIDENINRTFELANRYLDDFHQAQLDLLQEDGSEQAGASGAPTEEDA